MHRSDWRNSRTDKTAIRKCNRLYQSQRTLYGEHSSCCYYKYCFTDVMIKWPRSVHDARMFSTSILSNDIRNGSIPRCGESHQWRRASSTYLSTWGSRLPFIALFDERICEWRKRQVWIILWFSLVLGPGRNRVRIGRLKARFGCLRREMDINIRELPNLINSWFVLKKFCEERKEPLNQKHIYIALKYDKEFQPPTDSSYKVSNSETGGKQSDKFTWNTLNEKSVMQEALFWPDHSALDTLLCFHLCNFKCQC